MSTCGLRSVISRAARSLTQSISFELVESYPDDKYLPSYLILAGDTFHVLFAADTANDHVRVVTAYRPDPDEWEQGFRTRRIES
jgi:hypothetical protein